MAEGYVRKNESLYDIPQQFADRQIGECPFCKTKEPKWLTREQWKLMGNDYYFKCPVCGSEFMATKDDVTGLSFSKASRSGKKKAAAGKIMNAVYITVLKIGIDVKTHENALLQGEELPLEKLKEITR